MNKLINNSTHIFKHVFLLVVTMVLMYPIIAHHLMYEFDLLKDKLPHGPLWLFIQIFLSGPTLLIFGLTLVWKRKSIAQMILGIFYLGVSVYWLYAIIQELTSKS